MKFISEKVLYNKSKKSTNKYYEEVMLMKDNKFTTWVKAYKRELFMAGVTIVGTVLVVKNWDSIKGLFNSVEPVIPPFRRRRRGSQP